MPNKTQITLDCLSQPDHSQLEFGIIKPDMEIRHPGALFPRIEE